MSRLRELQADFRAFLAGESPGRLFEAVVGDGLAPEDRLGIYRNNVRITLGESLRASFPIVCRLVEARFFDHAARVFLQDHWPRRTCLSEFGGDFPAFLRDFAPASGLPYLADVARLEWAVTRVIRADPGRPVTLAAVAERGGDPAALRLTITPAVQVLDVAFPADSIFWANQPEIDEPEPMMIEKADLHLQIRFCEGLSIQRLEPACAAFRAALISDATLGSAVEAAFALDPGFDLPAELANLFHADLVVGVAT